MIEKEIDVMKKRGFAELEVIENTQRIRSNNEPLQPRMVNSSTTKAGSRFSEDAGYIALVISIIALLISFYPSSERKIDSQPPQSSGVTSTEIAKVNEALTQLKTVYQDTTRQLNIFEPRLNSLENLSVRLELAHNQLIQIQAELNRVTSDIQVEQIKSILLQTKLEATHGIQYEALGSRLQEIRQMAVQSNLVDKDKVVKDIDAILAKGDQGESLILAKLESILKEINTALEMK
jgi:hypothetical protein